MKKEEIIKGLESLIEDRKSLSDEDDKNCVSKRDIEVLESAIGIIKVVLEAPIQEQPFIPHDTEGNYYLTGISTTRTV